MSLHLIRQSLAEQHVAIGDVSPAVYHGDTLPGALYTTHLPCRLLFAGDEEGGGNEGAFVALGKLTAVTFNLSDLMFWRPVGESLGRSAEEQSLEQYLDNYLAMLRDWRAAGQTQAHVTGFRANIARITYPTGGTDMFWSVACVVSVEEFYSGA